MYRWPTEYEVHADLLEPVVDPVRDVRLDPLVGALQAVPDRPPVYAQVEGDVGLAHPAGEPGDLVVELDGEPAFPVGPRDPLVELAALVALDALRAVAQEHGDAVEVRGPPDALFLVPEAVPHAPLHALLAPALPYLVGPHVEEVGRAAEVLAKVPLDDLPPLHPLDARLFERDRVLHHSQKCYTVTC